MEQRYAFFGDRLAVAGRPGVRFPWCRESAGWTKTARQRDVHPDQSGGPLLECQLMETPLLSLINFPTLIATKAARICWAARGDPVLEFGLRQAHGVDSSLAASRAAYIGGCAATSNVLAGKDLLDGGELLIAHGSEGR